AERVVLFRVKHGAREHRCGDAAVPQISVRSGNVEERRGIGMRDEFGAWSCQSIPLCEILMARLGSRREVAERDPWRVAYDGVIQMDSGTSVCQRRKRVRDEDGDRKWSRCAMDERTQGKEIVR